MLTRVFRRKSSGYLAGALGIAVVTAIGAPLHAALNNTTVALAYLLVVLLVATVWGSWPALLASGVGVVCFNFFFLPPVYTLTIADPQNWVALAAFLVVAVTAGQLSELAKRRAAEAEAVRKETRLASAHNRSLLEASLDALVTIGADGKINDANTAIETLTGSSRATLIGSDFANCFSEPENARTVYREVLREGFVRDRRLELRHRDGHVTSVVYNAALQRDDEARVIGVMAAIRSIATSAGQPALALADPDIARSLSRFVAFASQCSIAVGLLSLLGWTLGVAVLKSVIPGQVVIKPNAAVELVLSGCALWLLRSEDGQPPKPGRKRAGRIAAATVTFIGLLSVSEHLFGWHLGIDQLLFRDQNPWEAFGSVRPGLMAPITALDFSLLGLALLSLDFTIVLRSVRYGPAQALAFMANTGAVVGLLDFVLGSHTSYTHVALQTAVTLVVLSFAVACARTSFGLGALFTSSSYGGMLTRRLWPAAVLIPLLIGTVSWKAYAAGLLSEWSGITVMIVAMITLLAGLTVWSGQGIDRSDAERRQTEAALRRSEEELREAQRLARVGSWWCDPATDGVTWSEGLYRIAGRDPKLPPPVFKDHSRFYTPESFARLRAAVDGAVRIGTPFELELELVRADGSLRWVTSRGEAERDGSGRVVRVRGTVQDVTERKQAEEALLRVNRAHRALSSSNQALSRATEESALLEQICRIIVAEAGCRFCWVGRAEPDAAKTVTAVAQAGIEEGYLQAVNVVWADSEGGRGPTGTCIRTGERQLVKNTATDPGFAPWRAEALKRGYASVLAIPLFVDSKPFGALSIYAGEAEAFRDEELALLSELAGELGYGVTALRVRAERQRGEEEIRKLNAELEQRVRARTADLEAALEREAKIGFKIQQMLLLTQPPTDLPGLQVAALTIPSQRIDGDFYDFFKHENQCLDVMVADVMGKGILAALVAAATKSNFLEALCHLTAISGSGRLPEPKAIVTLAHADMVRQLIDLESFVTVSYARFDLNRRQVDLVDCGHTGMMIVRAKTGACEIVHGTNLPLGIREGEIFDQLTVSFEPGDLFLFYSDGITETRNLTGELYGAERLSECVRINRDLEPRLLVDVIRQATVTFAGSDRLTDDLTCVAVRIRDAQQPLAHAELEIASDLGELRRARRFVREFCHAFPEGSLADEDIAALELAVNEASSNIMRHAYRGRADQRIQLEADRFQGHLSIRLHHLGESFDAATVAPPALDGSRDSGFGVYMIGRSVDDVRYSRDERGRNCITLVKVLSA